MISGRECREGSGGGGNMLPVSELRSATTQMLSTAAVVVASELICEINPHGRTRSLADALEGTGGIVVATELQDALRTQIRAHEILVHYQLRRLATRALAVVVKRAAETSQKPAIQAAALELREFAPTVAAHWKSVIKDRSWKPVPIQLPPLPGFLYRFDTGLTELRTLDISRWRLALRDTRDVQEANVSNLVLDLLAPKLYRLHPQACLECLSLTPRNFDGLRLRLFQAMIEHLLACVEQASANRRREIRDPSSAFLIRACSAHARFLQQLDAKARARRGDRLAQIQSLLLECENCLSQPVSAPSEAKTAFADRPLVTHEMDDTAEFAPSTLIADQEVAAVPANSEGAPPVPKGEEASVEPYVSAHTGELTGPAVAKASSLVDVAPLISELEAVPEPTLVPITTFVPVDIDGPVTARTITTRAEPAVLEDADVPSNSAREEEACSGDNQIADDRDDSAISEPALEQSKLRTPAAPPAPTAADKVSVTLVPEGARCLDGAEPTLESTSAEPEQTAAEHPSVVCDRSSTVQIADVLITARLDPPDRPDDSILDLHLPAFEGIPEVAARENPASSEDIKPVETVISEQFPDTALGAEVEAAQERSFIPDVDSHSDRRSELAVEPDPTFSDETDAVQATSAVAEVPVGQAHDPSDLEPVPVQETSVEGVCSETVAASALHERSMTTDSHVGSDAEPEPPYRITVADAVMAEGVANQSQASDHAVTTESWEHPVMPYEATPELPTTHQTETVPQDVDVGEVAMEPEVAGSLEVPCVEPSVTTSRDSPVVLGEPESADVAQESLVLPSADAATILEVVSPSGPSTSRESPVAPDQAEPAPVIAPEREILLAATATILEVAASAESSPSASWTTPVVLADLDVTLDVTPRPEPVSENASIAPDRSDSPAVEATTDSWEFPVVIEDPEIESEPSTLSVVSDHAGDSGSTPITERTTAMSWDAPVVIEESGAQSHDTFDIAAESARAESARSRDIVDATGTLDLAAVASSNASWESPVVLEDSNTVLDATLQHGPVSETAPGAPEHNHSSAVEATTASWEFPVVIEDADIEPEPSTGSVVSDYLDTSNSVAIAERTTNMSWEAPVVLQEPGAQSHDRVEVPADPSHEECAGTRDTSDAAGTLDVPAVTQAIDESWESPVILEEAEAVIDSAREAAEGPPSEVAAEPSARALVEKLSLEPVTDSSAAVPQSEAAGPSDSDETLAVPVIVTVPVDSVSEVVPSQDRISFSADSGAAAVVKPDVPATAAPLPGDPEELRRAAAEAQSRRDLEHAEKCLRQLVTVSPADVGAWDSLAQLHLERQQDLKALECLIALRRLVPAISRARLLADEQMAGILTRLNRHPEAFACLESACEIAERRHREESETAESLSDLSRTLMHVSKAQISGLDPNKSLARAVSAALPRLVRCLTIRERIVSRFGKSVSALREVAEVLVMVADTEFDLGNWHSAFGRYSRAIELHRTLIADYGSCAESLRDLSRLLECAGSIRRFGGDLLGAAASYQSSLENRLELLSQDRSQPEPLRDVAAVLEKLGDIARSCGNGSEATMHFRRALGYREQVLGKFGDSVDALKELADLEWRLSQTLPEEASVHLERGRAAIQSILDHDWGDTATQAQLSRFERQLRATTCAPSKFKL